MKFQFNYLQKTLSRTYPNTQYSYELSEERAIITQYGGMVFILEPSNHWINFTVKSNHITVFYKKVLDNGEIIYYRRDFARAEIIGFEFTEEDQVIKNEKGRWIPKRASG